MATVEAVASAEPVDDRTKVVQWKLEAMTLAGWPVAELLNSRMGPIADLTPEKQMEMLCRAVAGLYVEFREAKEKKAEKEAAANKMGLMGGAINERSLRLFRKSPLGLRWGSVTTNEDTFSDDEED